MCVCLCGFVYISAGTYRGIEFFLCTEMIGDCDCLIQVLRTEHEPWQEQYVLPTAELFVQPLG